MLITTLHSRPCPPSRTYQSPFTSNPTRRTHITRAGFLDRLLPGKAPTTKSSTAAGSIKQSLLNLTKGTDAGIKATPALLQEIEQQVAALEKYCIKSPLTNPLIFGDWQIIFASKPTTAGGPFRSSIGRAVLPDQTLRQVITPPNQCTNIVSFKGLGFIPGKVEQQGIIEAINSTTFQLTFPQLDEKMKGRAGGPRRRVIEITYLDEDIRVGRFIPEEDSSMDGSFYIFKRLGGGDDEEEEEDDDEEEGWNVLGKFFSSGRSFSAQSEKRQATITSSKSAEAARVERERRIATMGKDKQLKAEKREQAIAQINELREEATRAANEAKEAQGEYRSAEREGSAVLRQAASARTVLNKVANEVEQALGRLERLKDIESEAAAAVAEAAARVKSVRSALQKKS